MDPAEIIYQNRRGSGSSQSIAVDINPYLQNAVESRDQGRHAIMQPQPIQGHYHGTQSQQEPVTSQKKRNPHSPSHKRARGDSQASWDSLAFLDPINSESMQGRDFHVNYESNAQKRPFNADGISSGREDVMPPERMEPIPLNTIDSSQNGSIYPQNNMYIPLRQGSSQLDSRKGDETDESRGGNSWQGNESHLRQNPPPSARSVSMKFEDDRANSSERPGIYDTQVSDYVKRITQRLEDMARRDEVCDLYFRAVTGSGNTVLISMHLALACAASPALHKLLFSQDSFIQGIKSTMTSASSRSSGDGSETSASGEESHGGKPGTQNNAEALSGADGLKASAKKRSSDERDGSVGNDETNSRSLSKSPSNGGFADDLARFQARCSLFSLENTKIERKPGKMGIQRTVLDLTNSGLKSDTLESIRMYIYTGVLRITQDSIFDLLRAALSFDIKSLVDATLDEIQLNLNEINVFLVTQLAITSNLLKLEDKGMTFLCDHFDECVKKDDWLRVDVELIRRLVRRDNVRTFSEVQVFRALARWAQADVSSRATLFVGLIYGELRLSNMSRPELIEVSEHPLCSASQKVRWLIYNEALERQKGKKTFSRPRRYDGSSFGSEGLSGTETDSLMHLKTKDLYNEGSGSTSLMHLSHCTRTIVHERAVSALAVFGNFVITASGDYKVRVFNSNTWECEHILEGHTSSIVAIRIYNDLLISSSPDRTIRIWSTATWQKVRVILTKNSSCSMIFVNKKLVIGSDDGVLETWSTMAWVQMRSVIAHQHVIWALERYGNETLISASSDTSIKIWSVGRNNFYLICTLNTHSDEVQALAVDQANHLLFSGSDDGTIAVHDCRGWQCLRSLPWHNRAVLSLLSHGNELVAGLGNGVIHVWRKDQLLHSDENLTRNLAEHTSCVMDLATSHGRLISASYDRTVKVWERW